MGAKSVNFDGLAVKRKAGLLQLTGNRLHHRHTGPFLDFVTLNANEQQLFVLSFRATATDEGV